MTVSVATTGVPGAGMISVAVKRYELTLKVASVAQTGAGAGHGGAHPLLLHTHVVGFRDHVVLWTVDAYGAGHACVLGGAGLLQLGGLAGHDPPAYVQLGHAACCHVPFISFPPAGHAGVVLGAADQLHPGGVAVHPDPAEYTLHGPQLAHVLGAAAVKVVRYDVFDPLYPVGHAFDSTQKCPVPLSYGPATT